MSRHWSKKADANQPALVEYIRSKGASWQHTHRLEGALDGIIGYEGIDQRVEIKDPAKPLSARQLTDAESKVFKEWKGRPPVVIETEADVDRVLEEMKNSLQRQ